MYELHAIIVKKPITKNELNKIHHQFINDSKHFIRETKQSYRLRNYPKTYFKKDSFRTKIINDKISLIYGIFN